MKEHATESNEGARYRERVMKEHATESNNEGARYRE